MGWLQIRNWDKWQTYRKDRQQPPWIKLHRALLRDADWISLSDAQRGQLISIWMLAADKDGRIPADPKTIQKMCFLDRAPDLKLLMAHGFIEQEVIEDGATLAPGRRQDGAPEKSRVDIEESRRERGAAAPSRSHQLPQDWTPTESHFLQAESQGFSAHEVDGMAEDMRCWAWGKGAARKNWDMVFSGWMRRERKNGRGRGQSLQQTRTQVAIGNLRERARNGLSKSGIRDGSGELSAQFLPAAGFGSRGLRSTIGSPLHREADSVVETDGEPS